MRATTIGILFEVFFGIERKLNHALEEVVGGKPGEVVVNQLLNIQAADVAKFERAAARGIHEITVGIVYDDQVARLIITRPPKFAGSPFEGVCRKALPPAGWLRRFRQERVRHSN